jgi:hypothetical protein
MSLFTSRTTDFKCLCICFGTTEGTSANRPVYALVREVGRLRPTEFNKQVLAYAFVPTAARSSLNLCSLPEQQRLSQNNIPEESSLCPCSQSTSSNAGRTGSNSICLCSVLQEQQSLSPRFLVRMFQNNRDQKRAVYVLVHFKNNRLQGELVHLFWSRTNISK